MTTKKQLIKYEKDGEWGGYTLSQRGDGLWEYWQWSAIQGCRSGRRVVIEAPADLVLYDEADLDTNWNHYLSKAEYLKECGMEVRCLRRGWIVQ